MRRLTAVVLTATFPLLNSSFHSSAADAASFTGKASYYSGHRTASGAPMRNGALTAAHRTLPFGTQVKVTNLDNGRSANLIINDRGPFIRGRVIDVSLRAADVLAFRHAGVAHVKVETLGRARVAQLARHAHHRHARYARHAHHHRGRYAER